ncbi:MAG: hypothetical protein CL927_03670 [Deltaproteobacteria bacterium]|nr:hypothetical protein [Deltaproteobacteria bacterium]HCH67025.1 hypothetical protein [Deltaproteobacteria bacterium]
MAMGVRLSRTMQRICFRPTEGEDAQPHSWIPSLTTLWFDSRSKFTVVVMVGGCRLGDLGESLLGREL